MNTCSSVKRLQVAIQKPFIGQLCENGKQFCKVRPTEGVAPLHGAFLERVMYMRMGACPIDRSGTGLRGASEGR